MVINTLAIKNPILVIGPSKFTLTVSSLYSSENNPLIKTTINIGIKLTPTWERKFIGKL